MSDSLPPCGLYRTTKPLGSVPAGRLVSFHNHGDPGPGVYLPRSWTLNKASFAPTGQTLPAPWEESAATLEPLPAEGFYRVLRSFHCCDRQCRLFGAELFVQLGYDGEGNAILFLPSLGAHGLSIPSSGTLLDASRLPFLAPLQVEAPARPQSAGAPAGELH